MSKQTIRILIKYKDGNEIEQLRGVLHRSYTSMDNIKQVLTNKIKTLEKVHKKFNNNIVSIEIIEFCNFSISDITTI